MVTEEEIKAEIKKCGFRIADPEKPLKYIQALRSNELSLEVEFYNFIQPLGSNLTCAEKIMNMIDELYKQIHEIICSDCKGPFRVPHNIYLDLMDKRLKGHEIVCPICIEK